MSYMHMAFFYVTPKPPIHLCLPINSEELSLTAVFMKRPLTSPLPKYVGLLQWPSACLTIVSLILGTKQKKKRMHGGQQLRKQEKNDHFLGERNDLFHALNNF